MTLAELNQATDQQARQFFENCCVSTNWINAMVQARPFSDLDAMMALSETVWRELDDQDYLEAFEGHPRIGDVSSLQKKYADSAALASHEQSGMTAATQTIVEKISKLNDAYFEKYGFIFIVCASGKSAQEMLSIMEARINNDYKTELAIAASEQEKITRIRLAQLDSQEA